MFNHFNRYILRTSTKTICSLSKFNFSELPDDFKKGIYIASNELWQTLEEKKITSKEKKHKIELTLFKYWIRNCSKSTPFGTFASVSLGNFSNNSSNILISEMSLSNKVRLDSEILYILTSKLLENNTIKLGTKYYLNNSAYEIFESFRFTLQEHFDSKTKNSFYLVERNKLLDEIINSTREGLTYDKILSIIIKIEKVSFDEATNFVDELISSKVLISELEPITDSSNPIKRIIDILKPIKYQISDTYNTLISINNYLSKDNLSINELEELKKILIKEKIPYVKNFIQVDTFDLSNNTVLEEKIINKCLRQLSELSCFSNKNINLRLENFKDEFKKKYDNRAIKLNFLLDTDFGINYPNIITNNNQKNNIKDEKTIKFQKYILSKYITFLKENKDFIEITKTELLNFKDENVLNFPSTFHLLGSFFKKSKKFDVNNFMFLIKGVGGPSGANLMGRFAYADSEILQLTKDVIDFEEKLNEEVIFAEIIHLSEPRLNNVSIRPQLRKYEIPYITKSNLSANFQINIDDLYVFVQNNNILLWSKKYNKRVIPRLTTAHNFSQSNNLPIYRFLCDLQSQGTDYINFWDWNILSDEVYLPRVIYKNLILKRAQWILPNEDFLNFQSIDGNNISMFLKIMEDKSIPNEFFLVENENEFLINLNDINSVQILNNSIKKNKKTLIKESFTNSQNLIINDFEGKLYESEFLIPISFNKSINEKISFESIFLNDNLTQRKFIPFDSNWLYIKIYGSNNELEKLLKNILAPFIFSHEKISFDYFFFIRYTDPKPHLRLRFFSKEKTNIYITYSEILKKLKKYIDNEIIDIAIDSYERELERYGHDLIEESELIFYYDSKSYLNTILKKDIDNRLIYAIISIHNLLNDFDRNIDDRIYIFENLNKHYSKLLKNKSLKYESLIFYNTIKNDIFNILDENPFQLIFSERSLNNKKIFGEILKKTNNNNSIVNKLINSYIHMLINRIFPVDDNLEEAKIYNYMLKIYKSIYFNTTS